MTNDDFLNFIVPWWIVGNRLIFRTGVTRDDRRATCDAREEA